MSGEKQIEELTFMHNYGTFDAVTKRLYKKRYRAGYYKYKKLIIQAIISRVRRNVRNDKRT